jgi:hypothetical protein
MILLIVLYGSISQWEDIISDLQNEYGKVEIADVEIYVLQLFNYSLRCCSRTWRRHNLLISCIRCVPSVVIIIVTGLPLVIVIH